MTTAGIRVLSRHVRKISTLIVSSALGHRPSSVLQMAYGDFWTYSATTMSSLRALSINGIE